MKPYLLRATCWSAAVLSATVFSGPRASAAPPVAPPSGPWTTTFNDNFDGGGRGLWVDAYLGSWKSGTNVAGNAYEDGGNMVLRTSFNTSENRYESAILRTRNGSNLTHAQKYGYFEARIKLSTAGGQWAAFWMMPQNSPPPGGNPDNGVEIDIVEGFGRDAAGSTPSERGRSINQALHWSGYGPQKQYVLKRVADIGNNTGVSYKLYGLLWTKNCLIWYVDGIETMRITNPAVIPDVQQYLKLSHEVVAGTGWAGTLKKTELPAYTYVDYVKAYTFNGIETSNWVPAKIGNRDTRPDTDTSGLATGGTPGGGGGTSGTPQFNAFIEAENMQLDRLTSRNVSGASGGKVVASGGGIGVATATHSGQSNSRTLKVQVYDKPGNGWIKFYKDGQEIAYFALNANNNAKVLLKHTTYWPNGAKVDIKVSGSEDIDYVSF